MGFEPTTFCMAISEVVRQSSVLNQAICRAFVIDEIGDIQRGYERIGVDMQRVRHFSPEVPEIKEAGSSRLRNLRTAGSSRDPSFNSIARAPGSGRSVGR
jgi:hypothetical protein